MSRYRSFVLLGALALASVLPGRADAATFRVGAGRGCTHSSVQSAVNAARAAPGFDTIRITQSLNYIAQGIVIRDQDVQLVGGYIDCLSVDRDGLRHTTLSGAGGSQRSVIQVAGWGAVYLQNLEIRDGDDVGLGDQYGGGIDVIDGPHGVVLLDVLVVENHAGRGGGISLRNRISTKPDDMQLVILSDTQIDGNTSGSTGGGVYCSNGRIAMSGPRNRIWANNAAWAGGGLRLEDCTADLGSPSNDPKRGTISYNTGYDGGGLSAGGERTLVRLFQTDASAPFAFIGNRAKGQGGALEVEAGAQVSGHDTLLLDNTASSGGAVRVVHVAGSLPSTVSGARFTMTRNITEAPFGAVNCKPSLRCNRIAGNSALDGAGGLAPGGAIVLYGETQDDFPRIYTRLEGTTVRDNIGSSLFEFTPGHASARLTLDGAVVVRNTVLRGLINNPLVENGAYSVLNATTIADNKLSDPVVFNTSDDVMILRRTIIHQPGSRTLGWINGTVDSFRFDSLLATDFTGLPDSPDRVLLVDPRFVDTANGDYRLQLDSPAIDFAQDPDLTDLDTEADGATRIVDLPSVGNRFGSQDLGAYERQSE